MGRIEQFQSGHTPTNLGTGRLHWHIAGVRNQPATRVQSRRRRNRRPITINPQEQPTRGQMIRQPTGLQPRPTANIYRNTRPHRARQIQRSPQQISVGRV